MVVNAPKDIFNKIKVSDLEELIDIANRFQPVDKELLLEDYNNKFKHLEVIRQEWSKSVEDGSPDFTLYGHQLYLNETFDCWRTYSRKYLNLLKKIIGDGDSIIKMDEVKSVLDLGCGCAYTTVGLLDLFPDATVYATNLSGTLQYNIDECVTENFDNIVLKDESYTFKLPSVDLVFASEFFEHQDRPVEFIRELISTYNPKYIVFANTFTQMALGHFVNYYDLGEKYTGKDISRLFNKTIREAGYVKANTGFFNNRPSVYIRCRDSLELNESLF